MAGAKYPLSIVVSALDKVTAPMRVIEQTIDRTLRPLKKLRSKMKLDFERSGIPKFQRAFGQIRTGVTQATRAIGGMILRLGALGAAGAAAGLAILHQFARSTVELADFARQVGLSVGSLAELQFVARANGVETDTLNDSLRELNVRMVEAVEGGTGDAFEAFKALGISVTGADGRIRELDEILPEIADKLDGVESAAARTTVAAFMFGEEGMAMVNVLRGGAAQLEATRQRARELGVGLQGSAVPASKQFVSAVVDMTASLKSLATVVLSEVMPVVAEWFERLRTYLADNREAIVAFVQDFMAGLPDRLSELRAELARLWAGLKPVLDRFAELASWLAENNRWVPVLTVGIGALAAIILVPLVVALKAAAGGVIALGIAILTTPVGWILAGIAGLVAGLIWLGDNWDWLGDKIDSVVAWIVEKLEWLWDKSVGVLEDLGGWITGLFGDGGQLDEAVDNTRSLREQATQVTGGGPGQRGSLDGVTADSVLGGRGGAAPPAAPSELRVKFEGTPEGVTVEQTRRGDANLALEVAPAMPGVGS